MAALNSYLGIEPAAPVPEPDKAAPPNAGLPPPGRR
jgi:hypothetical protein